MKTADFLTAIYGDATGIATLVVRSASTGELTEQKFYEYPEQKHEMVAFATAHAMEDVYFSPILFNAPRRIKENAKTVHVIYADADACQPENFLVEPSISVQTSDKRWHTYWMLDQEVEPLEAALLAKKIAYAIEAVGAQRFDLKYSNGPIPQSRLLRNIELYATEVVPRVKKLLAAK